MKKRKRKSLKVAKVAKVAAPSKTRVMMQCASLVNKDAVRRESIDGVEHIVVSSFTMPDDVVMNGILYPANEISDSFQSLERTLAPVEHPTDKDGRFISASDPTAIHNFHAGAFNVNVDQIDGRVHIEKFINVQEAQKTDRGKRLLDRINEIETSENPRPIHTSTGVFLVLEDIDGPQTNKHGTEYNAIARDLSFDHDAILLDSVGAAQPHQGVGMAVNAEGDLIDVRQFTMPDIVSKPLPDEDELSHSEIRDLILDALKQPPYFADWIVDVFEAEVIFESDEKIFSAPYIIDQKTARITGIPLAVVRDVVYSPKTNKAGDPMKDMIINALTAAGVAVDGLDDEALFAKYNELQANQGGDDDSGDAGEDSGADAAKLADVVKAAVTNAIAPVAAKIEALELKVHQVDKAELDKLAKTIGESDVYQDLTAEDAAKLGVNTLKTMVANCKPSFGINAFSANTSAGADDFATDMPE